MHYFIMEVRWNQRRIDVLICYRISLDFFSHPPSCDLKNADEVVLNGDLEVLFYCLFSICLLFTFINSLLDRECYIGSIVSSIPPIYVIFLAMLPEYLSIGGLAEDGFCMKVSCVFRYASCSLSITGRST